MRRHTAMVLFFFGRSYKRKKHEKYCKNGEHPRRGRFKCGRENDKNKLKCLHKANCVISASSGLRWRVCNNQNIPIVPGLCACGTSIVVETIMNEFLILMGN